MFIEDLEEVGGEQNRVNQYVLQELARLKSDNRRLSDEVLRLRGQNLHLLGPTNNAEGSTAHSAQHTQHEAAQFSFDVRSSTILTCTEAFSALLKYPSPEHLVGKPLEFFVAPEYLQRTIRFLRQPHEENKPIKFDQMYVARDGEHLASVDTHFFFRDNETRVLVRDDVIIHQTSSTKHDSWRQPFSDLEEVAARIVKVDRGDRKSFAKESSSSSSSSSGSSGSSGSRPTDPAVAGSPSLAHAGSAPSLLKAEEGSNGNGHSDGNGHSTGGSSSSTGNGNGNGHGHGHGHQTRQASNDNNNNNVNNNSNNNNSNGNGNGNGHSSSSSTGPSNVSVAAGGLGSFNMSGTFGSHSALFGTAGSGGSGSSSSSNNNNSMRHLSASGSSGRNSATNSNTNSGTNINAQADHMVIDDDSDPADLDVDTISRLVRHLGRLTGSVLDGELQDAAPRSDWDTGQLFEDLQHRSLGGAPDIDASRRHVLGSQEALRKSYQVLSRSDRREENLNASELASVSRTALYVMRSIDKALATTRIQQLKYKERLSGLEACRSSLLTILESLNRSTGRHRGVSQSHAAPSTPMTVHADHVEGDRKIVSAVAVEDAADAIMSIMAPSPKKKKTKKNAEGEEKSDTSN